MEEKKRSKGFLSFLFFLLGWVILYLFCLGCHLPAAVRLLQNKEQCQFFFQIMSRVFKACLNVFKYKVLPQAKDYLYNPEIKLSSPYYICLIETGLLWIMIILKVTLKIWALISKQIRKYRSNEALDIDFGQGTAKLKFKKNICRSARFEPMRRGSAELDHYLLLTSKIPVSNW